MTNWKNFERRIAKHFGTTRVLRGDDFGQSKPDIVTNAHNYLGGDENLKWHKIYIECKYSQDQTWKKLMGNLCKSITSLEIPIVMTKEQFVFWYLEDTHRILSDMFLNDQTLYDFLTSYRVLQSPRKVPQYLKDHLVQAQEYANDPDLSLVCLGHKGSKKVVTYTTLNELTGC